jgi:hypothetical protein
MFESLKILLTKTVKKNEKNDCVHRPFGNIAECV